MDSHLTTLINVNNFPILTSITQVLPVERPVQAALSRRTPKCERELSTPSEVSELIFCDDRQMSWIMEQVSPV